MIDLKLLASQLLDEVDGYEPPPHHPQQLGSALPPEWFKTNLAEMRAALVEPHPLDVVDHSGTDGEIVLREVIILADDAEQTLLAFDPNPEGDFVLVWRLANELALSNIRGDAVGCFLSR